jgi:hypothetical protein
VTVDRAFEIGLFSSGEVTADPATGRVTWRWRHRPPLVAAGVRPRPAQPALPVWEAVGVTPARVEVA